MLVVDHLCALVVVMERKVFLLVFESASLAEHLHWVALLADSDHLFLHHDAVTTTTDELVVPIFRFDHNLVMNCLWNDRLALKYLPFNGDPCRLKQFQIV
jgi:hypothetical protein